MCVRVCVHLNEILYLCECVFRGHVSFTVHRNELKTTGTHFEYMCFFLYVYECTFVPKNFDRVHGH